MPPALIGCMRTDELLFIGFTRTVFPYSSYNHLLQQHLFCLPPLQHPRSLRLLVLQQTALSVASLSLCRPGFMALCMALHAAASVTVDAASGSTSQPSIPPGPDVVISQAAREVVGEGGCQRSTSLPASCTSTGLEAHQTAVQMSKSLRGPVCADAVLSLLASTRRHFNINYRSKGGMR